MINPKSQVESKRQSDKDEFWEIVGDCLVELHHLPVQAAQSRIHRLREQIESAPRGISKSLFYHNEPFDVACDLAEHQLDFIAFRDQYEHLLNRHGW